MPRVHQFVNRFNRAARYRRTVAGLSPDYRGACTRTVLICGSVPLLEPDHVTVRTVQMHDRRAIVGRLRIGHVETAAAQLRAEPVNVPRLVVKAHVARLCPTHLPASCGATSAPGRD